MLLLGFCMVSRTLEWENENYVSMLLISSINAWLSCSPMDPRHWLTQPRHFSLLAIVLGEHYIEPGISYFLIFSHVCYLFILDDLASADRRIYLHSYPEWDFETGLEWLVSPYWHNIQDHSIIFVAVLACKHVHLKQGVKDSLL